MDGSSFVAVIPKSVAIILRSVITEQAPTTWLGIGEELPLRRAIVNIGPNIVGQKSEIYSFLCLP